MSESEVTRFFQTCLVVYACLAYSFAIGKIVPKGKARALFISPIVAVFLLVPLRVTSVSLCAVTALLISWLATFKLALFSFGKGPLATTTFSRFLAVGSLPIVLSTKSKVTEDIGVPKIKSRVFALKALLFALLYEVIGFDDKLHPTFIFGIKGVLVCLSIDFVMVYAFRALVEAILGLEVDPLFRDPLLSSSVQNFWGRRWNLAMGNILRASVYNPVRALLSPHVGSRHAQRVGVLATFITSGIMHEIILYYLSRKRPTWEMSWYFLLQGVIVVVEMDVKRLVGKRWRLPRLVSTALALGFMTAAGMQIAPHIHHFNCIAEEFTAFAAFLRSLKNSFISWKSDFVPFLPKSCIFVSQHILRRQSNLDNILVTLPRISKHTLKANAITDFIAKYQSS